MNKQYYTESGAPIRYPEAYAKTGAPMFDTQNNRVKDINAPTTIYKLNLENGKKYLGKQRMLIDEWINISVEEGLKSRKNLYQKVVKLLMKSPDSFQMIQNNITQNNI